MLYLPAFSAIKACMSYTKAELCISLFIVASFVNSAILIMAAEDQDADLPGMYNIFVNAIGQGAEKLFAIGLLSSGMSAGIVATIAGQLICEGAMNCRMLPFVRGLVARLFSIIPTVIAAATGQRGLAEA